MIICKICNQEFDSIIGLSSHIRIHNINSSEYYLKYLKVPYEEYCNNPFCISECENRPMYTIYRGLIKGYDKYCSISCSHSLRVYSYQQRIIKIKNNDNIYCSFCDKKALFYFLNTKHYCCSQFTTQCSEIIKINKIKNKGRIVTLKTRQKIRNKLIGSKRDSYTKIQKKEMSEKKLEYYKNNPTTILKIKKSMLKYFEIFENNIYKKLFISNIKKKYPTFAKIEEMRYKPGKEKEKVIQVHCKNHNCKNSKELNGWFTPTYTQLYERIRSIDRDGSYFYCSSKCKEECPIYGKSTTELIKEDQIRAGIIEDPWYDSSEYQIWRQQVFKLDNNICQWCEEKATIAHHILPQKIYPNLSLDPENGLSCCKNCHHKYGHRDPWCTAGYLSQLACDRIIKIKNKVKETNLRNRTNK